MLKSPSAALALGLALLIPGPAAASGDPDKGETVFKKCTACHQVGEGAKHRIGPHLNGVIGRTAGTAEGFKYSQPMIEAGTAGLVWTAESLDGYLESPRTSIKGNRMAFPGLKDPADRADVTAYLARYANPQSRRHRSSPRRPRQRHPRSPRQDRLPWTGRSPRTESSISAARPRRRR